MAAAGDRFVVASHFHISTCTLHIQLPGMCCMQSVPRQVNLKIVEMEISSDVPRALSSVSGRTLIGFAN